MRRRRRTAVARADTVWSPASFVGGLVLIAAGIAALFVNVWFGSLLLGVFGVGVVAAAVVQRRRGHRRWCLVRRAVWFGISAPRAPVRVLVNAP